MRYYDVILFNFISQKVTELIHISGNKAKGNWNNFEENERKQTIKIQAGAEMNQR